VLNATLVESQWQHLVLEIGRYGFFEADSDTSAIHEPIPIANISKIFKSYFLLHCQKYDVFYALPSFKSLINQDLWVKI